MISAALNGKVNRAGNKGEAFMVYKMHEYLLTVATHSNNQFSSLKTFTPSIEL